MKECLSFFQVTWLYACNCWSRSIQLFFWGYFIIQWRLWNISFLKNLIFKENTPFLRLKFVGFCFKYIPILSEIIDERGVIFSLTLHSPGLWSCQAKWLSSWNRAVCQLEISLQYYTSKYFTCCSCVLCAMCSSFSYICGVCLSRRSICPEEILTLCYFPYD